HRGCRIAFAETSSLLQEHISLPCPNPRSGGLRTFLHARNAFRGPRYNGVTAPHLCRLMANRLRDLIESVVFAGLKPGAPSSPRQNKRLGSLGRQLDRFLDGGAQSDPLYLSNRSLMQRARFVAGILVAWLLGGGRVCPAPSARRH